MTSSNFRTYHGYELQKKADAECSTYWAIYDGEKLVWTSPTLVQARRYIRSYRLNPLNPLNPLNH